MARVHKKPDDHSHHQQENRDTEQPHQQKLGFALEISFQSNLPMPLLKTAGS